MTRSRSGSPSQVYSRCDTVVLLAKNRSESGEANSSHGRQRRGPTMWIEPVQKNSYTYHGQQYHHCQGRGYQFVADPPDHLIVHKQRPLLEYL